MFGAYRFSTGSLLKVNATFDRVKASEHEKFAFTLTKQRLIGKKGEA